LELFSLERKAVQLPDGLSLFFVASLQTAFVSFPRIEHLCAQSPASPRKSGSAGSQQRRFNVPSFRTADVVRHLERKILLLKRPLRHAPGSAGGERRRFTWLR